MSRPSMTATLLASLLCLAISGKAYAYEAASDGTRILKSEGSGTIIKMLVDESNLGGDEVEVGHITFPPDTETQSHAHASTEIFYVISGKLAHIVDGEHHLIEPGMAGIVRSGDEVVHKVPGDEPVKALVIWAPGGESDRLGFEAHPAR